MGQIRQSSQHLAGLVAVVVNRLLAQNHQAGLFFVYQGFEQFGNGQWLEFFGCLDQNAAVCANRHGSAQCFLALGHAAGDGDHFSDHAFFFQANGLFHRNLVKRVHAHLDVGNVDSGVV